MNKENKEMLENEIKAEIKQLSHFAYGSEEHSAAIDSVATLYKLAQEDDKLERERSEWFSKEVENQRNAKELKKDRAVKIGIAGAELLVPLIFYAVWAGRCFEFEENGALTSTVAKNLMRFIKPTKK
jgi:ubiquitin